MKVMQINVVYKKGSTGKITYDIHTNLAKKDIQSIVCYGRGEKCSDFNVYKTCGEIYLNIQHFVANLTGIMYGGCFISTCKLISVIKRERPDVVHLQCLNGYFVNIYYLVNWLKKNNIRVILTLHAEFMHTANCGYALECEKWKTGCGNCPRLKEETGTYFLDNTSYSWNKMKEAFDKFNDNLIVVSVSPWLKNRAKSSPILADKRHRVILNGLDTDIFKFYNTDDLKKMYVNNDEKIIFHATPFFTSAQEHIKGGHYVIELAKRLIKYPVKIIVAGNYDKEIQIPDNIILLGNVSNQVELAKLYSMADITLLTSKKETFSMVTAESLCCGTPVVGFQAGAPEEIAIDNYSDFVLYGAEEKLLDSVLYWLEKDLDKRKIESVAREKYSRQRMIDEYYHLYKEILEG